MPKLSDIFDIWYGVNLEVVNCTETTNGGIPFVSRTSETNGIATYVEKIDDIDPNPAFTLSIAGSGSVLSTFFHEYEYYSGRDLYIAKPKVSLSRQEMLYYCTVIESNKYRYSYGRQANKTLKDIIVPSPEQIPANVKKYELDNRFSEKPLSNKKFTLETEKWRWFQIGDLFSLEKCKCGHASFLLEEGNDIFYIGAKKDSNGIMQRVEQNSELTTKGNCIVFIGDGQGSVGYATYQPVDFIGSTTLTSGYSQFLNKYNAQFLIPILDQERFRYSFGRKYGYKVVANSKIRLPVTPSGAPDWQFMEEYIKGLPYSKNI